MDTNPSSEAADSRGSSQATYGRTFDDLRDLSEQIEAKRKISEDSYTNNKKLAGSAPNVLERYNKLMTEFSSFSRGELKGNNIPLLRPFRDLFKEQAASEEFNFTEFMRRCAILGCIYPELLRSEEVDELDGVYKSHLKASRWSNDGP